NQRGLALEHDMPGSLGLDRTGLELLDRLQSCMRRLAAAMRYIIEREAGRHGESPTITYHAIDLTDSLSHLKPPEREQTELTFKPMDWAAKLGGKARAILVQLHERARLLG